MDKTDWPVVVSLAIPMVAALIVWIVIVLCIPLYTREEIEAKKREKQKRNLDVLNVKSKGGT